MNKIVNITLLSVFFIAETALGQSWKYENAINDIDGKYHVASTTGWGGKYPYNSAKIILNYFEESEGLNLYLTNIGYTGCDNNEVIFVFDSKRKYRAKNVSTNNDRDALFIDEVIGDFDSFSNANWPQYIILYELMKSSKLYVRVRNDCHSYDFSFSLSGSSSAINKVLRNGYLQNAFGDSIKDVSMAVDNLIYSLRRQRELEMNMISLNIKLSNESIEALGIDSTIKLSLYTQTKIKIAILNYFKDYGYSTESITEMKLIPVMNSENRYYPQLFFNEGQSIRAKTFEQLKIYRRSDGVYDIESF